MTKFIAKSVLERLEREWRVIDPERPRTVSPAAEDDRALPPRRLRMGRFDEAEFGRD